MIYQIKVTFTEEHGEVILENSNGDTYRIKSEEAVDFFSRTSSKF